MPLSQFASVPTRLMLNHLHEQEKLARRTAVSMPAKSAWIKSGLNPKRRS